MMHPGSPTSRATGRSTSVTSIPANLKRDCTPEQQCGEMHLVMDWKDGSRRCRCGKVVEREAER